MTLFPIRPVPIPDDIHSLDYFCVKPGIMAIRIRVPGNELKFSIPRLADVLGEEFIQVKKILEAMTEHLGLVMAAFGPIFIIIQFVTEIITCIDTIANGTPQEIVQCAADLYDKLLQILGNFFPVIAIPPMIADIICVIANFIQVILVLFVEIIQQIERSLRLESLIPQFGRMQTVSDNYKCLVETKKAAINSKLVVINNLIQQVNFMLQLIGEDALGQVTITGQESVQQAMGILQQFIAILGSVPDTCLTDGDGNMVGFDVSVQTPP